MKGPVMGASSSSTTLTPSGRIVAKATFTAPPLTVYWKLSLARAGSRRSLKQMPMFVPLRLFAETMKGGIKSDVIWSCETKA